MTFVLLEGLDGGFMMAESSRERFSVDRRCIDVGREMEGRLGEDVDIGIDGRISGGAIAAIGGLPAMSVAGSKC